VTAVTRLESAVEQDLGVLVAPAEAAARLGVNAATIKQLVRAGRLRARRFGGQVYIPAEDVEKLQQQGTQKAAS
jgi:excisionase family DNA binding protein